MEEYIEYAKEGIHIFVLSCTKFCLQYSFCSYCCCSKSINESSRDEPILQPHERFFAFYSYLPESQPLLSNNNYDNDDDDPNLSSNSLTQSRLNSNSNTNTNTNTDTDTDTEHNLDRGSETWWRWWWRRRFSLKWWNSLPKKETIVHRSSLDNQMEPLISQDFNKRYKNMYPLSNSEVYTMNKSGYEHEYEHSFVHSLDVSLENNLNNQLTKSKQSNPKFELKNHESSEARSRASTTNSLSTGDTLLFGESPASVQDAVLVSDNVVSMLADNRSSGTDDFSMVSEEDCSKVNTNISSSNEPSTMINDRA